MLETTLNIERYENRLFDTLVGEIFSLSAALTSLPSEQQVVALARIQKLAKAAKQLQRAAQDAERLLREPESPKPAREVIEEPPAQELVAEAVTETPAEASPVPERVAPEPPTDPEPARVDVPPVAVVHAAQKRATPSEGRRYRNRLVALTKRHDELLEARQAPSLAWRSLVAEARGLKEFASTKLNDTSDIEPELDRILASFNKFDGGDFFGLNMGRTHPTEVWDEVAMAYSALGMAVDALNTMEREGWMDEVSEELVSQLSCAATCVMHVNYHRAMGINELSVWDIVERLRKQWPDRYMPALKTSEPSMKLEEVKDAAQRFMKAYPDFESSMRKRQGREAAKVALEKLVSHLSSKENPEAYVADLKVRIAECLDAGIPATDKELVLMLAPLVAFFEEGATGKLRSLVDAIHKKLTLFATKGVVGDPAEPEDVDPEHEERLQRLRPVLEGKVLLLVGGNKRQRWREDELKKALGLKAVLWPDLEDTSNYKAVFSDVEKADVVAQLIRWSRHHYSEVLDRAKERGKPVVRVLAGLGVRQIVRTLDEQLTVSE